MDASILRDADRDIVASAFLSDNAYQVVRTLVEEYGSRFGGTEGERGAAEYLTSQFREYGLENARLEDFSYTGWVRGDVRLISTAPSEQEFSCIALPHSPSADVEAELVYLGYATPAMFEAYRNQIPGKIVLADAKSPAYLRRGIHRSEKYRRAVAAGAVGFIWMRDVGGLLPETGGLSAGAPVPGVGVSRETGHELLRLADQGPVRVRIQMYNEVREFTSWNVVGELIGQVRPDEVAVVGAHFDGHDIAQGALDDASGAAVVLEAARLLAPHRQLLERTLRFICFPVEEIGLYGSRAYVAQHEAELDGHLFMLNLDGAGRPGSPRGLALQAWPELIPYFKRVANDMRYPLLTDVAFGQASDMYPFTLAGVPSGYLSAMESVRTGRNWGHTHADTLDKVSPLDLRMDAMLVARIMLRVAAWSEWPAGRKTQDEVRELLESNGVLRIQQEIEDLAARTTDTSVEDPYVGPAS